MENRSIPKISVVIPLYNKEEYIGDTLKAVINQSYGDFEVLVVNDGSTDNSVSIVNRIHDSRIKLINKTNEGVSATRNMGVGMTKGEYVFLLDADDIIYPNALSTFIEMEKDYPLCDIYVGSFLEKDSQGHIVKERRNNRYGVVEDVFKEEWYGNLSLRFGNFIFRKEMLYKVKPIREDLTLYEDLEWLCRLLEDCSKCCMSPKIVLDYVRASNGLSHTNVPIEKDYAGVLRLKEKKGYERKILADFLARRLVRRIINLDFHSFCVISKNNIGSLLFAVYSLLCRIFVKNRD